MEEARRQETPWKKWGPYLSERQWGTVRENTDRSREAWNDLTHEQSRSRAYHSGEDGMAGFCDEEMLLCFSVALWNGRDPILKERLFGLTNSEGNHGEDVKEYYFYLDSTPTHSYAKMLYKYPQSPFPYDDLLAMGRRSRQEFEGELLDTKIFDEDRYWDVFVEYAKADCEDILVRITAVNRGPAPATLHILPHLWFRNTWWAHPEAPRPHLQGVQHPRCAAVMAEHEKLGTRYLYSEGKGTLLFTNNETNEQRLYGRPNAVPFVKDGINDYVVSGQRNAVDRTAHGTKAAFHAVLNADPGQSCQLQVRLTADGPGQLAEPFERFAEIFEQRRSEADQFYGAVLPASLSDDARKMIRQGYSGLLWTKQAYIYDVEEWLEHQGIRPQSRDNGVRNRHWAHMYSADVISMPDKWEYPWFAAWDLAFHAAAFGGFDPDFAIQQLDLMLRDNYLHPNGQLPAYEWNFGDVNPPVHAWAALYTYRLNAHRLGDQALPFLKRTFHKLLFNFNWWLNRKDRDDRNLFEGGFLGLDNIGVFDRSAALPTGGYLEQADGTAWMALYAQNMLDIAVELALHDSTYEPLAVKFYEHFIRIAAATSQVVDQHESMWDEEDGFFYDVLRVPGQWSTRLKVRSVVGLLPLCAVSIYRPEALTRLPEFLARVQWFNRNRPELLAGINPPGRPGVNGRVMLSMLTDDRLRRVLARMLDPAEFLGDFGIRSLSRYHQDHPYVFYVGQTEYRVGYLPAESDNGMFGGNSNWRGPIWAPINTMLVRALLHMYGYYGDEFRVECPTGSGQYMTLYEVARELSNRLSALFLRDVNGRRPVYGGQKKFQEDPHWRDHILFFEYFHGDNGAGLGASHQTGWTAMIPALAHLFAELSPEKLLAPGRLLPGPEARPGVPPQVSAESRH